MPELALWNSARMTNKVTGRPRERQQRIRDQVIDRGFARVDELAQELAVSIMTVHRDLDELERQGWLRKVRGGATARPSAQFHGDVRHRMRTMVDAKEALAAAALTLVEPGQAIVIDESTTALALARRLPERGPLTVITHFLSAIKLLAGEPGIDLLALGGDYFPAYDAFLGLHTQDAIRPLRADTLFMSTTAITAGACFHLSPETIQVKRALMAAAGRRILLVDHTKLRMNALHRLASLNDFDLVVIDDGIAPDDLAALRRVGVPVEVAATQAAGDSDGSSQPRSESAATKLP